MILLQESKKPKKHLNVWKNEVPLKLYPIECGSRHGSGLSEKKLRSQDSLLGNIASLAEFS